MLQLYTDTWQRLGTLTGLKNIKIVRNLSDGDREISFSVSRNNILAYGIKNENYIKTQTDEFVIKDISEDDGDDISVIATLNLEDLEGKMFDSFYTTRSTVAECLEVALEGTGWTVGVCEPTKLRTIKKDAPGNALDIIKQCLSTYDCEIEYDTVNKTVNIYFKIGSDKGAYFIESLNLRKCSVRRTSYSFFTRLIPLGKGGIGIDVDGKNYVENHTYSQKIKTYVWKDERYTHPESLYEDAVIKLSEMAAPYSVYKAEITDLASASEIYRDILDYKLGDIVTLISKKTNIKEKMRIVKITEYPFEPQKNTCELANTRKSLTDMLKAEQDAAVIESVATAGINAQEAIDLSTEGLVGYGDLLEPGAAPISGSNISEGVIASERVDQSGLQVAAENITGRLNAEQINGDGLTGDDVILSGDITAHSGALGNLAIDEQGLKTESEDGEPHAVTRYCSDELLFERGSSDRFGIREDTSGEDPGITLEAILEGAALKLERVNGIARGSMTGNWSLEIPSDLGGMVDLKGWMQEVQNRLLSLKTFADSVCEILQSQSFECPAADCTVSEDYQV